MSNILRRAPPPARRAAGAWSAPMSTVAKHPLQTGELCDTKPVKTYSLNEATMSQKLKQME